MALGSGELSQDMTDAFPPDGDQPFAGHFRTAPLLISQLLYLLLHQLFRRSLNRDGDSSAGFLPALIPSPLSSFTWLSPAGVWESSGQAS